MCLWYVEQELQQMYQSRMSYPNKMQKLLKIMEISLNEKNGQHAKNKN